MNARILIAESDDRKGDHLLRLLAPHYEVERVADGTSAIDAALAGRADLVIAELNLPVADGHEIVRRLRAAPETKHLPTILLCDTAIDAATNATHEPAADDFLSRPFSSLELLMRVQSLLDMVRLRREGEERAMRILDGVTDAFVLLDARGRVLRHNAAFPRILGDNSVPPVGLIGSDFRTCPLMGTPDGAGSRAFAAAMATRAPACAEVCDAARQRYFNVRFFPEEEGGLCVFVRELTEEKKSRQALQDSEERRRLAIEAAGVYDWEYEPRAKRMIYSSNVEQVLGFALPDDSNASAALVHPEDRDDVAREYWESAQAGRTYLREYRMIHPKTGSIVWLRSEGYHVTDAAGNRRFLGITQNITARKSAEAASAIADEVDSLLGQMRHPAEIRQELARKLAHWFNATRCVFIEIDEASDIARVAHDYNATGAAPVDGVYRLPEYVSAALRDEMMSGQAVAVSDVSTDPRTALYASNYLREDTRSFLAASCVVHGRWKFLLTVTRSAPGIWSPGDAALLQTLASRIWMRIEQVTFEEQLHFARERLEMAMQAANIFWWEINLTTGSAVLSPNTSRVLGFSPPTDAPAMRECVHPDDRAFIDEAIAAGPMGGEHLSGVFRVINPKTKAVVRLSFQAAPAPDGLDGHSRVFGITQNITNRELTLPRAAIPEPSTKAGPIAG